MTRITTNAQGQALVIGAGLGGLASAMRLGAKGWRVTVIDRLDRPGGRGSSITEQGHRFDLGPTIVTVPQTLRDLWSACGRDFDHDVDLRPLDPFYEIRFHDGRRFTMRAGAKAMREEVARIAPADMPGFERFLKDATARYHFGFEDLGRRPMHRLIDLIKVLPKFAMMRADRSVHAHAARRVRDPALRFALSFHPLFIGGDPFRVTSMYALVSHLEAAFGVHYAMGGVQAIADAMVRVIRDQGGTVRLETEADEILVRNGRVAGARLATGEEIAAEVTVSNADPGFTYGQLLRNHPKRRWTDRRLARSRWSMGLFVWYFGTKGTRRMWPDAGHHTILVGPRYREHIRDIFRAGRIDEDMSLYVHRPTVTDPSAAPEGNDTFYALSPVPHLGHGAADWASLADSYKARVARMLEPVLPGFRERITVERVFTPETFRSRYLSPFGAGFSLEPRILQSAWFRPHNVSEELPGLYLAGAGTHPGAGVPGVLGTAEIVDQLVPPPAVRAGPARLPLAAE
ncbi:phytoene desaturase [Tabrizicola sp. YIM 78059]|uniref:phytoene desaturase n=1 Tax=Tabrizicola sp. YIM 78059 TaxID=2529861 RepID=UPI0010AAD4E4|nr:phytoene desaturase [Tabrizicola sp. YIM 78059]